MLCAKALRQGHQLGAVARGETKHLVTTRALEVRVIVRFAGLAGVETPDAVFARDAMCECLFHQPVQRAVQGDAIEFAAKSKPIRYFSVSECTLCGEKNVQHARARLGDAPPGLANELVCLHAAISA